MTGCGFTGLGCLFALIGFFVVPYALAALASPAMVSYLLLTDPRQLHHDQVEWLLMLAAAPLVSYALVVARRKGLTRADAGLAESRVDRRAIRGRRRVQAVLLLAVTNAATVATLTHGVHPFGRHAFAPTMEILGVTLLATVGAIVAFRGWDRWSPPVGEPVTVAEVRKAATETQRETQFLKAQNQKVERMANAVAKQLRTFQSEARFSTLRSLHFESFSCADIAHGHYRSAQTSSRTMTRLLGRARATCTPRIVPLRNPSTGRRERPDREGIKAAGADLARFRQELEAEVARGLGYVKTLNLNTAQLRDSIRDGCGAPGRRWYDALEGRKEHAKAAR